MREITDTTNKYGGNPIPEGTRNFVVAGEPQKKYGKGEFWVWPLQWADGVGEIVLLPNMMGGLLRVLGFKEIEPNKFDWDTTECEGKQFQATVKIAPDKKDPSKIRTHMSEFKEAEKQVEIPF